MFCMDRQKANGVYYTPEPLVRYIVRRTMDPLLEEAGSPGGAAPRVLDPACGDGAFLVETYRYLLEWQARHRSSFRKPAAAGGTHHAEVSGEPVCLLRNHIFGVDIDDRALRAARERLLRIALAQERKPQRTRRNDSGASWKRALRAQLRCGDALIEPEAGGVGIDRTGTTGRPFSWPHAFGPILREPDGGFDAVIGNPPYVNIRRLSQTRDGAVKRYLRERYRCARGAYDLYVLFLEKALELLRPGGRCGMVVPNKIAAAQYAQSCRSLLLQQVTVQEILDVSEMGAFSGTGVYPYVVIWRKDRPSRHHRVSFYRAAESGQLSRPTPTLRILQA